MNLSTELAAIFRRDIARVIQEVQAFPDDETLWKTLPGATNSGGNLALHLEGNLREFIGRQLGGVDYQRQRPLEFSSKGVSRDELVTRLQAVSEMVPPVLGTLTTEQLETSYPENVLGLPLTTSQFILHLSAHLNYHLGQMDTLRRVLTGDGSIKLANFAS